MSRVLLISSDVVGTNMAGMGVRSFELARVLSRYCEVTLAVPNQSDLLPSTDFRLCSYDLMQGDLRPLAYNADVVILQGFILHFHPYLRELGVPLAVDLNVPILLENLVWHDNDDWSTWIPAYEEYHRVQLELLQAGDFFFCGSERQRDYWLGLLHAALRLNPHTYRADPSFRKLVDVVPFGIPAEEPVKTAHVLKGVLPGIEKDDTLILWSGGLWDWLDPFTLLNALAELVPAYPHLKLYFMGVTHPNSIVTGMRIPERAIQRSQELGLYGRNVFFGEWVPYPERSNYLLEADFAVVAHPNHIETHFSVRSRVLDCIWTNLPLIVTDGDTTADWVRTYNLGYTVPPQDIQAMSTAIKKVLESGGRPAFEQSFMLLQNELRWEKVIDPLLRFCTKPAQSSDKGKYLTFAGKVSIEKDAYLNLVIREKNTIIEQLSSEKAYWEQAVKDKDAFLDQVIRDKDAFLDQVVRDKDAFLDQVVRDKDAHQAALHQENNALLQRIHEQERTLHKYSSFARILQRYHRLLPFKIYFGLKHMVNKR